MQHNWRPEVAVKTDLRNISIEQLQSLSMSMPNRLFEVILANGEDTKY